MHDNVDEDEFTEQIKAPKKSKLPAPPRITKAPIIPALDETITIRKSSASAKRVTIKETFRKRGEYWFIYLNNEEMPLRK